MHNLISVILLLRSEQRNLFQTPTLQHYTMYSEDSLLPIMQHMAKNVVKVNKGLTKQMTVKNKYGSSKQMKISTIPQLRSEVLAGLAQAVMP